MNITYCTTYHIAFSQVYLEKPTHMGMFAYVLLVLSAAHGHLMIEARQLLLP